MACTASFREAVVVCDSALRAGTSPQELRAALASVAWRTGGPAAARAVAFADGRSGSAGESLSRVVLHELGFDPEDLQTPFRDPEGLVGITDFSWLSHGTVGEFDGRVKYGRDASGGDGRDVLWREKLREDRLRALRLQIVRWTWADLDRPEEIARRIRAAWQRAAQRVHAA